MVDAGIMGQIAVQVPWNLVLHRSMIFERLLLAKAYMSVLTCYLFFCTLCPASRVFVWAGSLACALHFSHKPRILRAPACLSSES